MATVITQASVHEYKSEGVSWGLWACGLLGCCGLHRCYLGHVGTGVLWWCTGGLCGIGQCVDACNLSNMVRETNIRLSSGQTTVVTTSSPQPVMMHHSPQVAPQQQAAPQYDATPPGYTP
eukprot:TRINITY_DN19534_c1_g1_i4.p1 TRINITY_DN19534_c1_g1~~TRINITY_DN19534_c1_g1_i4.p1  ORF type:complete len:130 (+),score=13.13 TRINITY_DN19534_c1_g1_i4:31-390(+)